MKIKTWIKSNYLLFTEIIHFLLSICVGLLIYIFFYPSLWIFGFALLGGFLIDSDHLIDCIIHHGKKTTLSKFFSGKFFGISQKAYLIFHGWEYAILLIIISLFLQDIFIKYSILSFAVSLLVHLITDVMTNEATVPGYSIIYRYKHGFALNKLCKHG